MPDALQSTTVTFASGATEDQARVVLAKRLDDGRFAVATDRTPFHPVNPRWPDQPADHGCLTLRGIEHRVGDAIVGSCSGDGVLQADPGAVARYGEPGPAFLVLHVLDGIHPEEAGAALIGATVALRVDRARRSALSHAHTVVHLASLALNRALRSAWTKSVDEDALGHPNFDRLAIASSEIGMYRTRDAYRIGKSLRKRGFAPDCAFDALPEIQAEVEATLRAWLSRPSAVTLTPGIGPIEGRRSWACELPDGRAEIPCGGTHADDLARIAEATVELSGDRDAGLLIMTTACRPA